MKIKLLLLLTAVLFAGGFFVIFAISPKEEKNCIPTSPDAKGPFFVANTPVVQNLNRFGKKGEPMKIVGKIQSAVPPYPTIANAKVEIWQTDGLGNYYPDGNGDASDYADNELDMRGTIFTDKQGEFSVMSLFPARYFPRPAHIHYQVSAKGFQTLVTQHYFHDKKPKREECNAAQVDRSSSDIAIFPAPTIYLRKK